MDFLVFHFHHRIEQEPDDPAVSVLISVAIGILGEHIEMERTLRGNVRRTCKQNASAGCVSSGFRRRTPALVR
jgi:hypothetical protein